MYDLIECKSGETFRLWKCPHAGLELYDGSRFHRIYGWEDAEEAKMWACDLLGLRYDACDLMDVETGEIVC